MMTTSKPKFLIIDEVTNQAINLLNEGSSQLDFELSADINEPVTVNNSYKFECSFKGLSITSNIQELFNNSPGYHAACRLADELNDLIEEYHAPGTPRKERRAIKREFDKVFRIFRKHCYAYGIDFRFERPNS